MDESSTSSDQGSVDFQALILGFSSAALYYMGEGEIGGKQAPEKNLSLARQNIDIVLMLKHKTKGNLSNEEATLLEHVLGDLQVKFLDASK